MKYLLLLKLRQDPDNINNTDGWVVEAVAGSLEKSEEWHRQCKAALDEDAIEAYMVLDTTRRYVKGMDGL